MIPECLCVCCGNSVPVDEASYHVNQSEASCIAICDACNMTSEEDE